MDETVVRQAFVQRWRERLAGAKPLHLVPVDLFPIRMRGEKAWHRFLDQRTERHAGRHRNTHWRAEHEVVFPPDEDQLVAVKILYPVFHFSGVTLLKGDDCHAVSPCLTMDSQLLWRSVR